MVAELIDWLVSTRLSAFVLDVGWVWPIAETIHFTGLVLLAGTVGFFDLRLLGFATGIAPAATHKLIPIGLLGFALSIATGTLFIFGTPDQYFYNSAFHWKLVFLGLMGLNVAFFYTKPFAVVKTLGPDDRVPRIAKICAGFSLTFMIGVMCCGRMLTFFRPPGYFL